MQHIYFAQCGDRIKIGISGTVPQRLVQLRTGAGGELKLIAAVRGDRAAEKALHKKLKPYHLDGEWFRDCPEVRSAAQNCMNNFPASELVAKKRSRTNVTFAAVCKVIWPYRTDERLASIAGTDSRTARRWLAGDSAPPGVVFLAILNELVRSEDE